MKKHLIFLFILAGILASCSDDEKNFDVKLSATSCTLDLQNVSAEIQILNGTGEYTASTSDDKVANAFVQGSTLYIAGLNSGTASIYLIDKFFSTVAEVSVTTKQSITYPTYSGQSLFMKSGETRTFILPLSFESYNTLHIEDTEIATVEHKKSNTGYDLFTVTSKKLGISDISIKKGVVTICDYTLNVVEEYSLHVEQKDRKAYINIDNPNSATAITIQRGNSKYTATFTDKTVASAKVELMNESSYNEQCNPATVWIKPLKVGKTIMTITDLVTGQSALVDVEVYSEK